jgi:acetyltransferase-like isoleucine patch superfamily enzyme
MDLLYRAFDRFHRGYDDFLVRRLKGRMAACGERVALSPLCDIWNPELLRVGSDVQLNAFTHIFAGGGVSIGEGTLISSNCSISSVTHEKYSLNRLKPRRTPPPGLPVEDRLLRPVVIGRHVWIGTGAIILPGVTIGDHSIVGAGAVVTKSIPEKCVYVGNPARLLEKLAI